MKQMRSRFRLLTLLLVCGFLLTLVLCAGSVLKTAGITFESLSSLTAVPAAGQPDQSVSPSMTPEADSSSPLPENTPAGNDSPGTDNSPNPEYNTFGL